MHYNGKPEYGWITFEPLHELIEQVIAEKEPGFNSYKVVYASWFQGLKHTKQTETKYLEVDRNRHIDLIDAGVELKFTHNNRALNEKGVDVKMALEVLQTALDDKIDLAVLITGDGDFIPLVRALMKEGKRVLLFYFDFENEHNKSFANKKLINACNYAINFEEAELNKILRPYFKNLFRKTK